MKLTTTVLIILAPIFATACNTTSEPGFTDLTENRLSVKSDFRLHFRGKEIFVEKYKTYYFAHIEIASPISLKLESADQVDKFEISPISCGIEGTLEGKSIQFTIERPGYVMVRINEDQRVFIFADEPENSRAVESVSIMEYDVDQTGEAYSTAAVQKALDEISGSGKVLEFPAGVYKTGLLSIKSNSKIHLSPGAILLGPDHISELRTEEYGSPGRYIMIKDAENVEITGRGIIDANGRYLRDNFGDEARGRALLIVNSKKVTMDGIILRNSGSWNTHILYSEDIRLTNIKMLNDIELSNTDGFDPDASKNVLIEKCFAYCGDDNVAVKTTSTQGLLQDVEEITVRGCVFLTKKSALKVGTESLAGSMKNILFENNDILECDRGMTLYCYDGASYENIRYINNRFERNHPDRQQCGIHFRIRKRDEESRIGSMKKILVSGCTFSKAFPNPFELEGFDKEHKIELTIGNLNVEGILCNPGNESTFFNRTFADIIYK